ncbi:hypothetical protein ACFY0Z_31450 [Streptomyces kronopolitis]|uniref:hypothetical protein n=1 Tax=Streptomyces kronopolitis TaxID=1612435 RepID=UPI0036A6C82F
MSYFEGRTRRDWHHVTLVTTAQAFSRPQVARTKSSDAGLIFSQGLDVFQDLLKCWTGI